MKVETNKELKRMKRMFLAVVVAALAVIGACRRPAPVGQESPGRPAAAPTTNRIDVPDTVRRNLGITFARVEKRAVSTVIRVPGQFELQPEARREYRTMLSGRVELDVRQYEAVEAGAVLYRLASPDWRDLQQKLSEAESTIRQTEARVGSIPTLIAAHRRHEEILEENIALWEARVAQLQPSHDAGVVTIEELTSARNTLSQQRAELAEILEKEADLEGQVAAAQAEHDAAHARFLLLIATASTLLGMPAEDLAAPYALDEHLHTGIHRHDEAEPGFPAAKWRQIDEVEVRAAMSGVVASLDVTGGAWAEPGALVLTIVQPERLRFRAMAMQSDLGRLADGLPSSIVPPKGGTIDLKDAIEATLSIGLVASARERTVEVIAVPKRAAAWAKAGVAAHLEITTAGGRPELAIPVSSVVQDGLTKVFFRRDPKAPDKVVRVEADLGVDDGRWVVVKSGVKEGDEVVLDGVYQLMIATSGSVQKGGHFHSDGTFHAGEDE
ncbi:MAG: HlyD family efflux transporter periplasmic adaptor subunit [Planctomycetota bacterium]|nr:MAG: HlyD family efflux transporter periplasmic adaptor subunit [Planctomycetota bacterium]MCQ3921193.1 hypothetical protein [Planctomycetota bacterium]